VHTLDLYTLLATIKQYRQRSWRVTSVWKFLQTLFQEFYQKSQMWASTNYPMAEPRILDDFPSAVTLRERQVRGTEFPRIRSGVEGRTCSVDRQRKCSTAAFTGRDAANLERLQKQRGQRAQGWW
jgi:hypothetical protein